MRLELFNLGEPCLQPLDTFGGSVKVFSGPLRPRRQLVVVGQIVVDQEVECFCRLFQIEDFGPPLITGALARVELRLNVDEQIDLLAARTLNGRFTLRGAPTPVLTASAQGIRRIVVTQTVIELSMY